jgi:hypothetical protein
MDSLVAIGAGFVVGVLAGLLAWTEMRLYRHRG